MPSPSTPMCAATSSRRLTAIERALAELAPADAAAASLRDLRVAAVALAPARVGERAALVAPVARAAGLAPARRPPCLRPSRRRSA